MQSHSTASSHFENEVKMMVKIYVLWWIRVKIYVLCHWKRNQTNKSMAAPIQQLLPSQADPLTYEKLSMGCPTWEMCTSSRYWKGFIVGKVPSPGGSESQVPSIQDRGSITGFSWGVSVEQKKEGRMKTRGSVLCRLLWAASSWLEVNTKHLRNGSTPQKCFSSEQGQLQGGRWGTMSSHGKWVCFQTSSQPHTEHSCRWSISDSSL